MKLINTWIKLGVFVSVWVVVILLLQNTWKKPHHLLKEAKLSSQSLQDTSYFFLGSSRVQCGVNPDIIKKKLGQDKVYNLAVGGATFLNSCIIAQHLIQTKGHKTIFIELASIHKKLPEHIFLICQEFGINLPKALHRLVKGFDLKRQLEIQTHYLEQAAFLTASVKNTVQVLLNYKNPLPPIGFQAHTQNNCLSIQSFINDNEVLNPLAYPPYIKEHKLLIDYLTLLAQHHHARIIFLLPINFVDSTRKKQALEVYHHVPPHQKVVYTADFIQQMQQARFLKDAQHLNQWGAQKYTELLCPLIKPHF
ncbi:hypothetical protein [Microscilla marina]|uniref:SGNH/GDSL hydrolase family protein n=1 Tax=Microscilla marina ATCC 23134 TaxID=313606 RepID=A1ZCD4_MICM2|nr:hypothetical protein [Microscilla marina]EAY31936.1 hypothetical protein M23134_01965 [Microscilla marina ATCC 23134]